MFKITTIFSGLNLNSTQLTSMIRDDSRATEKLLKAKNYTVFGGLVSNVIPISAEGLSSYSEPNKQHVKSSETESEEKPAFRCPQTLEPLEIL